MPKNITKVKTVVKPKNEKIEVGWKAALADLQADIRRLKHLIPIIERKIKRGEPWPGHPATRN